MALTRDFKHSIMARAKRDPEFRAALLVEGLDLLVTGDVKAGKLVLRQYINATIGFERLAKETGKPAKSLMRMFGPIGNPSAENLFSVIAHLQKATDVRLKVTVPV